MRKLAVILLTTVLPVTMFASWSGAISSQLDLAGNWTGSNPPDGNTEQGDISIAANPGFPYTAGVTNLPAVGPGENILLGTARIRGVGSAIYTQTGGTVEWLNGTGGNSKGISFYSRGTGVLFGPTSTYGPAASASNPTLAVITGGTMITDGLGVGTAVNSGFNTGGDYTLNTGAYVQDGWGRLELSGTATFVIRPNRYVAPNGGVGYVETTPYWSYNGLGGLTTLANRSYGVAIAPNSKIVLSDNAQLVVPLPIFAGDRDVIAALQYYQSIGRFVSGPGSNPIQYDFYYGDGMQDGVPGGPLGGYAIVRVPEPGSLTLLALGLGGFLMFRRRS